MEATTDSPVTAIPIAVEIEAMIWIDGTTKEVWQALTEHIGTWWAHSYRDDHAGIFLEPKIGGRFWERFDESGDGALYGIVTYIETEKTLRLTGSFGLPGARHYVKTYRLEGRDGGTLVRTTASMLGDISEETKQGYAEGGQGLLLALKGFVEGRTGRRRA